MDHHCSKSRLQKREISIEDQAIINQFHAFFLGFIDRRRILDSDQTLKFKNLMFEIGKRVTCVTRYKERAKVSKIKTKWQNGRYKMTRKKF